MKRLGVTRILIAGMIFFVFSLAGVFNQPRGLLETLELKALDLRFKIRGGRVTTGNVVIAGIETRGIDAYGRWPWPRSVFAQLIVRLKESGARTIVIDLLFPEPEENRVLPVVDSLQKSFYQLGLLNDQFPNQIFNDEMTQIIAESDNDSLFAQAVSWSDNVIMGTAFEAVHQQEEADFSAETFLGKEIFIHPDNLLLPIKKLRMSARKLGYVNIFPDSDGTIRRILPVLPGQKNPHISLALAGAAHFLEMEPRKAPGRGIVLGDRHIPQDTDGNVLLDFYGLDQGFDRLSIADIIQGKISLSRIKDKVVVIGAMATGIGDIWPTPLTSEIPGVFIQATFLDNILENRFLRVPGHVAWAQVGSVFVMTLLALGMALALPPLTFTLAGGLLIGFYAGATQYLFQSFQLIWPLVLPLGAGVVTILTLLVFNFMVETRQHRWVKKSFSQYLSPEVIDILVKEPEQLRLGGEEKELTVIMADIRDFTSLSENLAPGELTTLLNLYLGELTDVILDNGGTLDKYMGDAIMAFFGAPLDDDQHPEKACQAAIQMCERLDEKRKEWIDQGLPDLRFGVGLSSGPMVVGNLGSNRRFDYSVIGDNVNLAARLEGLSKVYGIEVIISEQTRNRLDDSFVCRELDMVQVKGRQAPVRIFELLGRGASTADAHAYVENFEQGLLCYRQQSFETAINLFEKTLLLKPADRPSQLFIQRCQHLMAKPKNENWDGTWTFTQK
ncbi:MAG: adenylate/guanylate cyclase domain-containing protein [Desulfotignum sp.]|nr:adenylate/guanylate cyclase domain-containing protein [Desulfotignum sp.]MCF8125392.1 adenylate/guanylate cyclase domain-containing protein [Desulfotignum sp.]